MRSRRSGRGRTGKAYARIAAYWLICLCLAACRSARADEGASPPAVVFESVPSETVAASSDEETKELPEAWESQNLQGLQKLVGQTEGTESPEETESAEMPDSPALSVQPEEQEPSESAELSELPGQSDPAEGNGKVVVLYTGDVHCGIDRNFGYAGLRSLRDAIEDAGYATILLDNGDAVQGGALGDESRGEAIIPIMNSLGYDAAVPGNHEFDFGIAQFRRLVAMADFPYVCCNLLHDGSLLLKPYIIKTVRGIRIAVVGFTTPWSLDEESRGLFLDENGELRYDFLSDGDGRRAYEAVQQAVDSARREGADYVYLSAHAGNTEDAGIFSGENLIRNTTGIDVLIDGHSEDLEQIHFPNRDGTEVLRSACGYQLNAIGYSVIDPDDGIEKTGIWIYDGTLDVSDKIASMP